jgi:site-specific recombinase XerD
LGSEGGEAPLVVEEVEGECDGKKHSARDENFYGLAQELKMPTYFEYEGHLRSNFSPNTAKLYLHFLRDFGRYVKANGVARCDSHTVQSYVNHLGRRCGPETLKSAINALRCFFSFFGVNVDFKSIKTPRVPKVESKYLDEKMLARFEALVKTRIKSPRLRTILLLLPHTGLRISEICCLTVNDVMQSGTSLKLRVMGKGRKERVVPLNSEATAILLAYMRSERPSGRLFCITPDAVRDRMQSLRQDLGIAWLTPHKLRHTFGFRLVKAGVHPKVIAKLLGHGSLKSTDRYLHSDARLDEEAVEKLVRASAPVTGTVTGV